MIATLRPLIDLRTLAAKVHARGWVLISTLESKSFIENAKKIGSNVREIPDSELCRQFREFLKRIESVTKGIPVSDLKSGEVIKMFLKSDKKLYEEIEMIVHIICVAAVTMSVESIIESQVSSYEYRFNKLRNVGEDRASLEMKIALNGPSLSHSKPLVTQAMRQYWKKESMKDDFWHFV